MGNPAKKIVKEILKTLEDQGVIARLRQMDDDLREEMEADLVKIVAKHMPTPRKHQKAILIDEHVS